MSDALTVPLIESRILKQNTPRPPHHPPGTVGLVVVCLQQTAELCFFRLGSFGHSTILLCLTPTVFHPSKHRAWSICRKELQKEHNVRSAVFLSHRKQEHKFVCCRTHCHLSPHELYNVFAWRILLRIGSGSSYEQLGSIAFVVWLLLDPQGFEQHVCCRS